MNDPVEFLRSARGDPIVDIKVLQRQEVQNLLTRLSEGEYLSEWKHHVMGLSYEYHIHPEHTGAKLVELYNQGVRAGNPRLNRVYSRNELELLIAAAP